MTNACLPVPACFLRDAETEGAHGKFDFASEKAAAPDDLRGVLDGACYRPIRSLPLSVSLYTRADWTILWLRQIMRASPTVGATTNEMQCS